MEWLGLHLAVSSPMEVAPPVTFSHTPWLVGLSFIIAAAACLNGVIVAGRVRQANTRHALAGWYLLGTLSIACGFWSANFLPILALRAAFPLAYEPLAVVLSAAPALLCGAAAVWWAASTRAWTSMQLLLAAACISGGSTLIASGTLTGVDSAAPLVVELPRLVLAVLLHTCLVFAALFAGRWLVLRHGTGWLVRTVACLTMGAAVSSLHPLGTYVLFQRDAGTPAAHAYELHDSLVLSIAIGIGTLLLSALMVLAEQVERLFQRQARDLRRMNRLLAGQAEPTNQLLRMAAEQDPLTSLLNRRGFDEAFEARLTEHRESARPLAVMFLDVDHFKRINDSLGHDAGDELLKVIAQRVRGALREGDTIARFGGDEFCILVPVDHAEEASALAERIMQKMKEPVSLAGRNLVMTTSIGIALFPTHGDTAERLLKYADMALYQSKEGGRNSAHLFDDQLKKRAQRELRLEEELREALADGEDLELHYQPLVDLRSGVAVQLEALIRWHHPRYGLLGADRFIGLAEANGLAGQIDDWTVNRACRALQELNAVLGDATLQVAVNCSSTNFAHEDLPRLLENGLRRSGIAPGQLNVEITEDALSDNFDRAVSLLKRIQRLGASISIDNFGTGFSSLPSLKRLPLDMVKIDRVFVQELSIAPESREIVEAIIAMAHAMRLKVVAEGVETEQQLRYLCEMGCDIAQGHLIAKPMPFGEMKRWLQDSVHRGSALGDHRLRDGHS